MKNVIEKYGVDFPIYVDSFNKVNFENTYKPWPERAFIFMDNKIEYIAEAKIEGVFWHSEISEWLNERGIT